METSSIENTVDLGPAETALRDMGEVRAGDLIPLLQRLQDLYGYLPRQVLTWASEQTGIPLSRMYGIATFYAQFGFTPHGRHTIRCCRGTACHVRGGKKVLDAVKRKLGIDEGETTKDLLFSLETVACLGACALSPVMVVGKTYHGKMTPRRAEEILSHIMREEA